MATLEKFLAKNYNLPKSVILCICEILDEYKKEPVEVPDVVTLKKYSEKAGIVTGLDYRNDKKLASVMKDLKILKWNPSLGGFIYPLSKHDTLLEAFDGQRLEYSDLTAEE